MRWKLLSVILLTAVMAALIVCHVHDVNGPSYWKWPWRRLNWTIYPLVILSALPLFAGQWAFWTGRIAVKAALTLVTIAAITLQLGALIAQPLGIGRAPFVVQNSVNTSYYNVAVVFDRQIRDHRMAMRDWLEIYPELMPSMVLHASFKPPGWICYYLAIVHVAGEGLLAAWIGAIGIAVLAASAVPLVYLLMRSFEIDEAAAFCSASFFAAIPSLILMFPQGDQAYPALTCLTLIAWRSALRERPWSGAVLFGTLLSLALFLSSVFLMLGLFLGVQTLLYVGDNRGRGLRRAIGASVVAVGVLVLLYVILWAATGFDPIETFLTAGRRSQADLVHLQRPWPLHWLFDFADIAIGTGFISVPLIAFGVVATWRRWDWRSAPFRLVFVGLLQVMMSVLVSVFPGENARLMLPIMPLLMAPIGIELARWPRGKRIIAYVLLVCITAAIAQNMIFLYLGPEIESVPR